jgi:hypothetical protein
MSSQAPSEMFLLDIGHGLKIGLKGRSIWQVWAKHDCFDMAETNDFYRVMVLLERPYSEAESLLNDYAEKQNAEGRFPLWRVVGSGLACQSDQWASLALTWIPYLPHSEKALLQDLLMEVRRSKWASQKSRQLADLYVKQIRATNK